ncbi:class I SAM-dependent methyltransferase [Kineosporia sp. J2-2]|uniref:Class I SAM-dependent methyltransferase n=1 Tax=Kineosporia corallincola TaxID=2835133 RepID=A0ABS5TRL9_9ACTN|nr:class I SAM-dependent methyltransferase [Kineosporia corallincola]MBT0773438.1 class I SAM-dependent methyltransferase [Kineosporia corallincola]
MAVLPRLTVAQTDALAGRVLDRCREAGVVDAGAPEVDWERFHALRERLYRTFQVPTTTLTPLSARVLYGVSAMHLPRSVVVLGCYAGNLMAWVTAPVLGPGHDPAVVGRAAVGLDVDGAAVETARANFAAAGFGPGVRTVVGDAFDVATHAAGTAWDLLLIDVDVPGARKSGYARLLERWLEHRGPGAVVIAHDVCHPVFRHDLGGYQAFAREQGASASLTLPVDECGLEVSRWPD